MQPEAQRGTADAVAVLPPTRWPASTASLVVLSGDCPLITRRHHPAAWRPCARRHNAAVVVLTMELENPFGYGRIVRDGAGRGGAHRGAEGRERPRKRPSRECNSGFYCFDARALFEALSQVNNDNAQGEFYLTDVLAICRAAGRPVLALYHRRRVRECLGVNSRAPAGRGHASTRSAASTPRTWPPA